MPTFPSLKRCEIGLQGLCLIDCGRIHYQHALTHVEQCYICSNESPLLGLHAVSQWLTLDRTRVDSRRAAAVGLVLLLYGVHLLCFLAPVEGERARVRGLLGQIGPVTLLSR